jgi:hypothetical protein
MTRTGPLQTLHTSCSNWFSSVLYEKTGVATCLHNGGGEEHAIIQGG